MPARRSASRFTLPDGTSETLTLTATASATPGPNEFTIGATSDVDRDQSAGRADDRARHAGRHRADGRLRGGGLRTISSISTPPIRRSASDGPPFDTRDRADRRHRGQHGQLVHRRSRQRSRRARPRPPRSTSRSPSPTALRANEDGIRWQVQNIATLAAMTLLADRSRTRRRAAPSSTTGSGPRSTVPPGTQIDRGHPGRARRRADHAGGGEGPPPADQRDAGRLSAEHRRRVERGGRGADPGAADHAAGLAADDGDAATRPAS